MLNIIIDNNTTQHCGIEPTCSVASRICSRARLLSGTRKRFLRGLLSSLVRRRVVDDDDDDAAAVVVVLVVLVVEGSDCFARDSVYTGVCC
jgi:hypothetical protein